MLAGQQPASHRTALFRVAARTAAVLAYMAVNGGRHDVAHAYCSEAEAFAQDIGDIETAMWTSGTRSLSAYYRKDYANAAGWAEAGIALSPKHPQAIRLYVNGLARALAHLPDPAGAIRAIGHAEDLSDRHPVTPALTPCISLEPYGITRTIANAITAHTALGDIDAVQRYERDISIHVATSSSEWTRALVGLDLATTLVTGRRNDLEHAMLLGHQVLRQAAQGPLILSVVQRAQDLARTAEPWHNVAVVQDYREALRAWSSTQRVQQLTSSATMPAPTHAPGRTPPHADDAPGSVSPHTSARSGRR